MKQQHGRPHEQAAAQRSGEAPPSSDIMNSNRNLVENYLRWALPACAACRQASGSQGPCSVSEGGACMLMCIICTFGPGTLLGQHSPNCGLQAMQSA